MEGECIALVITAAPARWSESLAVITRDVDSVLAAILSSANSLRLALDNADNDLGFENALMGQW
jgi:hypothetical protein